MDLPRLLDNVRCPQGAWTTLRVAHNSTSPHRSKKGFLIGFFKGRATQRFPIVQRPAIW
jgi:hypothetical protein